MSEQKVITKSKEPITKTRLVNDLKNIGIKSGDTLLVHSALSKIGWVCGAETTVNKALLEVVHLGNIVMPSHTSDNSDPKYWENPPVPEAWVPILYEELPAFEKDITPTRMMGRIAEQFRTFKEAKRSNHPKVSFSAIGKDADEIIKDHDLTPEMGANTPLGKCYRLQAKILLLGVDYDRCTCLHLSEVLSEILSMQKTGCAMLIDGKREWIWYEDFGYDNDDFILLGKDFEKEHTVSKGKIGEADALLIDMKELVDFGVKWIQENRIK